MSNPYIPRVISTLGPLYKDGKIETVTWTSAAEAKQVIAIIRQKKKEIQLIKQEITLAKKQIHSAHSNQRAHTGVGTGIFKPLIGGRTVGKINAISRSANRQHELKQVKPHEEAEQFIARVTTGLDALKLQIETWLAQHPK